jgi:hypothetical protein
MHKGLLDSQQPAPLGGREVLRVLPHPGHDALLHLAACGNRLALPLLQEDGVMDLQGFAQKFGRFEPDGTLTMLHL